LPNQYELLLNLYLMTGNKEALDFSNLSLLKMANGGIYDQVRGGFCRYSTDPYWFAPHFEKMLYDNAQLISLYSRAFSLSRAYVYEDVVRETLEFCFRELETPEGAFMAALDADSEGMEGRFYVWTDEELQATLGDDYPFAVAVFHIKKEGNWEHGYNILYKRKSPAELTAELNISGEFYFETLRRVRQKLFQAQELRERPGLDDKVITAWNGLMLSALADAGFYLNDASYTQKAERLADFLLNQCRNGKGLFRTYQHQKPAINGFLEDYACVIAGLIRLFETGSDERYVLAARELADYCIQHFYDHERGIFFFTSSEDTPLVIRKTDLNDDVIDSANSMLARSLRKLGYLFLEDTYTEISSRQLDAVRQQLKKFPGWYSGWAQVALMEAYGTVQMELCGPEAEDFTRELSSHLPTCMVLAHARNNSVLPLFQGKPLNQSRIYICRDRECLEPVQGTDQAMEILDDLWGEA
ncbi:MAG: thioredoxin domain-containing protein, partial [Bacteroidetes bacterium]|nr:thioredoxin domain-containing protein [Bacteroidota bacterium]